MVVFILLLCFLAGFSFVMGLFPLQWEYRPTLRTFGEGGGVKKKKKSFLAMGLRSLSMINRPLCTGLLRARILKDLAMGHVNLTPEEFFLFKEAGMIIAVVLILPVVNPDMLTFVVLMGVSLGYMVPEWWLKGRIKRVKNTIAKELPDAIDLLGLCVNAGLDFMLALKWVVEKSPPSVLANELNVLLQEINVGKTRRDALKDLAKKYEMPDLQTFSRTLIQADKMGTSISEALIILSEDMRLARFRRGEQLAMKAPLKLLLPLLFFIFPVVFVLVAGPIFLEFVEKNPSSALMSK